MSAHSFGRLLVRSMHFGASGNGTPYVSDGDTARVLFFANLSGAYGGAAGSDQAHADFERIAAYVNTHDELMLALAKLADAVETRKAEHDGYLAMCAQEARTVLARSAP